MSRESLEHVDVEWGRPSSSLYKDKDRISRAQIFQQKVHTTNDENTTWAAWGIYTMRYEVNVHIQCTRGKKISYASPKMRPEMPVEATEVYTENRQLPTQPPPDSC